MAVEHEYQVVARRYRPQNFHELVGQEHIAKALENAILNNRIGHAYLFTGARGVGKTSSARIFAKSLNCVEGPTSSPCGVCEICRGIASGDDLDVIEIDGASNRGIDQIRTLIQNVSVRPVRSRFKIFIIDEVHMLTNEAFNALLKTLEEPPEHVKFIFCTTEVNKIPITILSRCQRFDFAGIGTQAIAQRLQTIVENEGLSAEPEALRLLARRANGSMRDGQSLLEQLLAFTTGTLTLANVHQLLGTANDEVLVEILRSIVRNQPAAILRVLDQMLHQGTDPGQLLEQFFGCLRDLMALLAGCGSESFLFLPADLEEEARQMAQSLGLDLVLAAMQIADHTLTRMKVSTQARLLAEMAFVRICALQSLVNLSELVTKMESGAQFNQTIPARPSAALPASGFTPSSGLGSSGTFIPSPGSHPSGSSIPSPGSLPSGSSIPSPASLPSGSPIPSPGSLPLGSPVSSAGWSSGTGAGTGSRASAETLETGKTPIVPPADVRRSFVDELSELPEEFTKKKDSGPVTDFESDFAAGSISVSGKFETPSVPAPENSFSAEPSASLSAVPSASSSADFGDGQGENGAKMSASSSTVSRGSDSDGAGGGSSISSGAIPAGQFSAASPGSTSVGAVSGGTGGTVSGGTVSGGAAQAGQEAEKRSGWSGDWDESEIPSDVFEVYHSSGTAAGVGSVSVSNSETAPNSAERDSAVRDSSPRGSRAAISAPSGTEEETRVWQTFLDQLHQISDLTVKSADFLFEVKNLTLSADGLEASVTYPRRCEFALQQFLRDAGEVKQIEEMTANALRKPGFHLKFILENDFAETPKAEATGIRRFYSNPLIHAAEELFDATIQRVEQFRQ